MLVRNGNEVGAFVLQNQQFNPEVTDYIWFLRTDRGGTFKEGDAAVKTGVVTKTTKIAVGGWVYFSNMPADLKTPAKFEMCVTTATNVHAINANDFRWRFRERPSIKMERLYKAETSPEY